jgi:hypothetical protein
MLSLCVEPAPVSATRSGVGISAVTPGPTG